MFFFVNCVRMRDRSSAYCLLRRFLLWLVPDCCADMAGIYVRSSVTTVFYTFQWVQAGFSRKAGQSRGNGGNCVMRPRNKPSCVFKQEACSPFGRLFSPDLPLVFANIKNQLS
eukprot:TRINITY_DN228_c0_g1_i4.p1 TRINITY_DN228_c0_g1~~TRINITY_DN228_c0_g1_i4.p1  ORF type:complete len:113 (-),score=8.18 TRINITY_DN228_c0_g1_i4:5-343(-)